MAETCVLGIDDLANLNLEAEALGYSSPCELCTETNCPVRRIQVVGPASMDPDVAASLLDIKPTNTQGRNVYGDFV